MSTTFDALSGAKPRRDAAEAETVLDGAAAAFGLSAAITILFNTLLAWLKDAYEPLNSLMAALTGHHWRTHGLVDIIVFVVVGYFLMQRDFRMEGTKLALLLVGAIIVGGGGLALWFVLV
jgi:hypothetical protein